MELPSNYLEEMKELLGDQYEAYLASFEQKTRQGLRVNTAKIAPETFRQKADISLECVPWCENGFAFDEKQTVTKHPYYYAGLYYVQEPSAMIGITPSGRAGRFCAGSLCGSGRQGDGAWCKIKRKRHAACK